MLSYWMHMKQKWITLLIVSLALAGGCTPKAESLAWEKIVDGRNSKYQGLSRIVVVSDVQDIATVQNELPPLHLQLLTSTNLSAYLVVVIYQGMKGVYDYQVEVSDVQQDKNTIKIYAQFHEPTPGTPTRQAVSSSYYILKIKKTETMKGNIEFVLIANGKEEDRQTHNIP